jgi:hypothetical protein
MNEKDLEILKEFDPEGYNYAITNRDKLIVLNKKKKKNYNISKKNLILYF